MKQLALPLDWPGRGDEEFLVSQSNLRAVRQLQRWGAWPVMAALLTGPRKSGRSLLARGFAAQTGGEVVDDAERADEEAVFHAWNRAQASRRPLLIVADAAPPLWEVTLPDLRSRLAATPLLHLDPPDEALMARLALHLFARRGLHAGPEVLHWLTARLERTHLAVIGAVDLLDAEATGARRRLSIPLARATLTGAGFIIERSREPRIDPD